MEFSKRTRSVYGWGMICSPGKMSYIIMIILNDIIIIITIINDIMMIINDRLSRVRLRGKNAVLCIASTNLPSSCHS